MKRPNVLWICTDQQRWDTIASLGNAAIRTPNIDRLVRSGVACTNAFCQSPICTPSRASFLTGRYPDTAHACSNGNERWAEAAPLVTKLLADEGYCCGLVGKLHLAGAHGRVEPRPVDDGYAVYEWSHSHRDIWPAGHAYADWVRSHGENLGRLYEANGYMPTELHQSTWCGERAVDFISRTWDQPWLLSVNFFDPHQPLDPPPDFLERYRPADMPSPRYVTDDLTTQAALTGADYPFKPADPASFDAAGKIAAYYAMIELIDENVGRMIDALEATGQRENTLVIFMSDHGEMLGDHGLMWKGCRFYEGLVHVPLVLSMPGTLPQGEVRDGLVELTDVAPTLLDLCAGAPGSPALVVAAAGMAGRSLVPYLTGAATAHRDQVRCVYYDALSPVNPERVGWARNRSTMLRTLTHKLVVHHGHDQGELYDLAADPDEHVNLWNDPGHAGVQMELMKRSFDATAAAVDTGPPMTRKF